MAVQGGVARKVLQELGREETVSLLKGIVHNRSHTVPRVQGMDGQSGIPSSNNQNSIGNRDDPRKGNGRVSSAVPAPTSAHLLFRPLPSGLLASWNIPVRASTAKGDKDRSRQAGGKFGPALAGFGLLGAGLVQPDTSEQGEMEKEAGREGVNEEEALLVHKFPLALTIGSPGGPSFPLTPPQLCDFGHHHRGKHDGKNGQPMHKRRPGLRSRSREHHVHSHGRGPRGKHPRSHSGRRHSKPRSHSRRKHSRSHSRRKHSRSHSRRKNSRSHSRRKHSRSHSRRKHSRSHSRRKHSRSHSRRKHSRSQSRRKHSRSHSRRKHSRSHSKKKPSRSHSGKKHSKSPSRRKHSRTHSRRRPSRSPARRRHSRSISRRKHSRSHSRKRHSRSQTRRQHSRSPAGRKHSRSHSRRKHSKPRSWSPRRSSSRRRYSRSYSKRRNLRSGSRRRPSRSKSKSRRGRSKSQSPGGRNRHPSREDRISPSRSKSPSWRNGPKSKEIPTDKSHSMVTEDSSQFEKEPKLKNVDHNAGADTDAYPTLVNINFEEIETAPGENRDDLSPDYSAGRNCNGPIEMDNQKQLQ